MIAASYPIPKIGDVYITDAEAARVQVRRVARDRSWADVRVTSRAGATWTKRQPLVDGRMPYLVREVGELIAAGVPVAGSRAHRHYGGDVMTSDEREAMGPHEAQQQPTHTHPASPAPEHATPDEARPTVPYESYAGGLSEEQRDDLIDQLNITRVSIWSDEKELDEGHFRGRDVRQWLDVIGHPSAHPGCCRTCGCATTCMGGAFFDATVATVLRELNRHGLLAALPAPAAPDREAVAAHSPDEVALSNDISSAVVARLGFTRFSVRYAAAYAAIAKLREYPGEVGTDRITGTTGEATTTT